MLHTKRLRPPFPPPTHHHGLTGGVNLEDVGVNEEIILNWILKELGWSVEFIRATQNSELWWAC